MAGPYFNGDEFQGVDSDAVGDGETDATTMPLSTGIEQVMDNNARWLRRNVGSVSHAPLVARSNPRRFASLDWTAQEIIQFDKEPGLQSIKLYCLAAIDSVPAEGSGASIDVKLELVGVGETDVEQWTGDGTLQQYTITLDVETQQDGPMYLVLWTRSQDEGLLESMTSGGVSMYQGRFVEESGVGATFLTDNANATSYFSTWNGRYELFANVAYWPKWEAEPSGTTGEIVPAVNIENPTSTLAVGPDIDARALSYIEPLNFVVLPTYNPERGSRGWTPKRSFSMRAGREVIGQDLTRHISNVESIVTRPVAKHLGPTGEERPTTTWPANTNARWVRAYGDEGKVALDSYAVHLDQETGVVEVRASILPVHIVEAFRTRDFDDLLDARAFCDWTITAEITQFTAGAAGIGDAEAIASASVELTALEHYPTAPSGEWPSLLQIFWSYFHQDATGADHYTFREGQLYEADLPLLVPVTIRVDTSGVSAPLCNIQLFAECDGSSGVYAEGLPTERDAPRLALFCPHVGIWERGVLS